MLEISLEHIETYLVELRERTSSSTAATRYRGLRQMFKWLVEEGEITRNPFERMRPPKVEERAVPVIPKAVPVIPKAVGRVDQVSRRHRIRRPPRHGYRSFVSEYGCAS